MADRSGSNTTTRAVTALALVTASTVALWANAQTASPGPGPGGSSAAAGASAAPAAPSASASAEPAGASTAPSGAGDVKSQCVAAFESYQDLRQAGALVQAQKETLFCAQAECPEVIKAKCGEWVRELKSLVPSVVFTAVDSDGKPLSDVTVQLDGKVVAAGLDAKPYLLDPGPHHLHYERAGAAAVDQDITVRAGEQGRKVQAKFLTTAQAQAESCQSGAAAEGSSGLSPVAWIGFSVAGTGLIIGAVAGILELTNVSKTKDACETQGCTQEQIDGTRSVADVATASFVVAGVGLVTGIIAAVVSGSSSTDDAPAAAPTHPAVSLQPLVGPGFAGVQGRF